MPLLRKWKYKDGLFAIWQVTETMEELMALLKDYPYLDKESGVFKSEVRRMEYLSVRVLLKEMTGLSYRILHHPSGKPYLEKSDMNISISHTKGFVAIGLHPHLTPGIDIEYTSDRVRKVVSRFVSEDEMSFLLKDGNSASADDEFTQSLLIIWSAKETMYKIIDRSEIDFKEHLRIYPFNISTDKDSFTDISCGVMDAQEYKTSERLKLSIDYMFNDDFVCTYSLADLTRLFMQ